MNTRTLPTLACLFFAGLILQMLACVMGLAAALISAMIWPLVMPPLMKFFDVQFQRAWVSPAICAAAIASGTAISFLGSVPGFRPPMWLAPVLTMAVASALIAFQSASARRCSLCNSRIGSGVAFSCPRCSLLVCERKCWNFALSRCLICEQNQVPVLPPDGRWWDKRLGPRSAVGRCQSCQSSAQEMDLRACAKCGRGHCRECWDHLNGQCSRCGWVIDDLPESLQAYLLTPPEQKVRGR